MPNSQQTQCTTNLAVKTVKTAPKKDLDPSKAWIKNIGVGSAKKLPRKQFNPNPENIRTPVTKANVHKEFDDKNLSSFTTPKPTNKCQTIFINETVINETIASLDTFIDSNSTIVNQSAFETCNEIDATINDTINMKHKARKDMNNPKIVKKMTFFDETFGLETTNLKAKAKNSPKSINAAKGKVMPSQFMYNHDEITAESTLIPFNSTEASTTCVRIEKAARELRNMNIANGKLSILYYSSELKIKLINRNLIVSIISIKIKKNFRRKQH